MAFHKVARGEVMYIDEEFFVRRKSFQLQVMRFNQSMYYYLTEFYSQRQLALLVVEAYGGNRKSMYQMLNDRLFHQPPESILNYKITGTAWRLFRYNRAIVRHLSINYGVKFDVEYILDRRMLSED